MVKILFSGTPFPTLRSMTFGGIWLGKILEIIVYTLTLLGEPMSRV